MTEYQGRNVGFEEEIIKEWNSVVSKTDTVVVLGDLAMGKKDKIQPWTNRLKGKKYLVLGNHDSGTDSFYSYCDFTVVPDLHEAFRDKYDNWAHYLFTHEPVFGLPDGWINVHGHLHGNTHRQCEENKKPREKDMHFDVGVDAIGYKPIRLFEIMSRMKK